MKKIIYLSIGVVWAALIAIIVMGVLVAPDLDLLGSLQRYKTIGQNYLDRKEIDPATIKIISTDDEFLLMYAKYMRSFQISENEYGAAQRLFQVAIEPSNLVSLEQVNSAYAKLDALSKQTQRSYDLLLNAQTEVLKKIKELKGKNLAIYGKFLDDAVAAFEGDEAKLRDDVTKSRLAAEKYYAAILGFLLQKQGAYTVEGRNLIFLAPEDQEYYNQLKQGQKTYEQELSKRFEAYQQNLRKVNSEIPVDAK